MIMYPEGGIAGTVLKQKQVIKPRQINNVRVQLIPTRPVPKVKINSTEDVVNLAKEMQDYDREYAKIIILDIKNQLIGVETISIGSLNASIVHPREAIKGSLLANAASVIFLHNHPSGICEPSREDIEISKRLKEAFQLVGIDLLDSIIVGKGCHYSLREAGYITGKEEKLPGVTMIAESQIPLIQHIKQEIKAIHTLATKNDPAAARRAENAKKQIDSGALAKLITAEEARTLKEAIKKALYKLPYIELAKLLEEKEIVTAEPVVLKTEKLGTMYLSYVQLGKEVYSEWGKTPEEAVRNARAKAEKQVKLGREYAVRGACNCLESYWYAKT